MSIKPEFPLRAFDSEDNNEELFANEEELVCTLEWFDSTDADETIQVTDSKGRPVRLKIKQLQIIICEIET